MTLKYDYPAPYTITITPIRKAIKYTKAKPLNTDKPNSFSTYKTPEGTKLFLKVKKDKSKG